MDMKFTTLYRNSRILIIICLLIFLTRCDDNETNNEIEIVPLDVTEGIIAFTSDRDGQREIYFMTANGSNQVRVTNTSTNEQFLRWSPDGSKLAFRKDGGIYFFDIIDVKNIEVSEPSLIIEMGGAKLDWKS